MAGIKVIVLCELIIFYARIVNGQSLANVYQLHSDIFSNYNKEVVPNANLSQPLHIDMKFYLFTISTFEEIHETIEVLAGVQMTWVDGGISWNPASYGGAGYLSVLQSNIWTPPLVLMNGVEDLRPIEGESEFMATILYNGTVVWIPGGVMSAKCTTDISKFPFDSQTCTLLFGTWALPLTQVILSTALETPVDLVFFTPNSNWNLKSYRAYTFFIGGYVGYSVEITIKREPLYFTLMVVCPTLLFGLLNPLVFLLPVESGERVGLAMTILLSYAIFLTLVSAAIPSSSNPMCILLIMMVIIIIVSGAIVTCVICISSIYHRDKTREVNKRWKLIVFRFQWPWSKMRYESLSNKKNGDANDIWKDIGVKLGLHRKHSVEPLYDKKESEDRVSIGENSDEKCDSKNKGVKRSSEEDDFKHKISWNDVADSLDLLCMGVSYVTIILIVVTFFIIVSN